MLNTESCFNDFTTKQIGNTLGQRRYTGRIPRELKSHKLNFQTWTTVRYVKLVSSSILLPRKQSKRTCSPTTIPVMWFERAFHTQVYKVLLTTFGIPFEFFFVNTLSLRFDIYVTLYFMPRFRFFKTWIKSRYLNFLNY